LQALRQAYEQQKSGKVVTIPSPARSSSLKLKFSCTPSMNKKKEEDKFRIQLSAASSTAVEMPAALLSELVAAERKVTREDTDWIDEKEVLRDEEWSPTKSRKQKKGSTPVPKVVQQQARPASNKKQKTTKGTSRSRLLSKFR
jgi:hypothetical protein